MSNPKPPFLDVEDDDQRQNRIGTLLERLNTTPPSSSSVSPNPLLNIGREFLPGPVKPPSDLLARVRAFLPVISASNTALSQQRPEDIDIENVPEDEEQYIEMNLGLGVFKAKPRPASPSSEAESEPAPNATSSESETDSELSRSSSEEDSGYSSASANDDSDAESEPESPVDLQPISSRPLKPLSRAKIEV